MLFLTLPYVFIKYTYSMNEHIATGFIFDFLLNKIEFGQILYWF